MGVVKTSPHKLSLLVQEGLVKLGTVPKLQDARFRGCMPRPYGSTPNIGDVLEYLGSRILSS